MTYTISEANIERQRLLGKGLESVTVKLLDQFKLPTGSRCLDIGCGLGETTRLIGTKIAQASQIIGLDQDASLLDMARHLQHSTTIPLEFQFGDAMNLPFEDQSFDLVYARYLLIHLPKPMRVLKEMERVCKSGGIIAVQEPDMTTGPVCYPSNWAFEKACALTHCLFADTQLGRKLLHMFRDLGYLSPHIDVDTILDCGKLNVQRFWRLTTEAICPTLITKGIIGQDEAQLLCDEMRLFEQETDVLYVSSNIFSGWTERN